METTLQRIKKFIDFKSLSISQFERNTGFSNGAFSSQLKNNKTIGVDKLENILKSYPEVSAEWLLTGSGEMIKSEKIEGNLITQRTDHYKQDFQAILSNVFKDDDGNFEINYNEIVPVSYSVKLYDKLKREHPDLFKLKTDVEILTSFKDAINDLIEAHFYVLQAKLWYHKGKISYSSYEKQVTEAINDLMTFNIPLSEISASIIDFYRKMEKTGKSKLKFEEYFTNE